MRRNLVLLIAGLNLFVAGRAVANTGGIAGYSGMNTSSCISCHTLSAPFQGVSFTGPSWLKPGAKGTFTFRFNGYFTSKSGGMGIAASGGALSVNAAEAATTKLVGAELVHSSPKPYSASGLSWQLDWTAPTVPGIYKLYGSGVAADGNGAVGGDWSAKTVANVLVGNCNTVEDCDDKNTCTTDACNTLKECTHTPIPNCCTTAADCDDGNPCTNDNCFTFVHTCVHNQVVGCCNGDKDCVDADVCTLDTCDLTAHKCAFPKIAECCTTIFGQCDDGNKCTTDSCSAPTHTCQHLVQPGCCKGDADCTDSSTCTTDKCDTATGLCLNAKTAGCCLSAAECDDKNPCTKDSCTGNKCLNAAVAGCCQAPADCDDKNPCTKDECNVNTCTHLKIAGCVPPDLGPAPADKGPAAGDGPRVDAAPPRDARADALTTAADSGPVVDRPASGAEAAVQKPPAESGGCCRISDDHSDLGGLPLLALLGALALLVGVMRRRR